MCRAPVARVLPPWPSQGAQQLPQESLDPLDPCFGKLFGAALRALGGWGRGWVCSAEGRKVESSPQALQESPSDSECAPRGHRAAEEELSPDGWVESFHPLSSGLVCTVGPCWGEWQGQIFQRGPTAHSRRCGRVYPSLLQRRHLFLSEDTPKDNLVLNDPLVEKVQNVLQTSWRKPGPFPSWNSGGVL